MAAASMGSRLSGHALLLISVAWVFVVSLAPQALGGHTTETPCSLVRQQIVALEESSTRGKHGSFGSIFVPTLTPSPPRKAVVRSIYLARNIKNKLEIGWKWYDDPSISGPNGGASTDPRATVFVYREIDDKGRVFEGSQGPYGNPSNPGWGLLDNNTTHTFRIIRNDETLGDKRYRLERDNLFVGYMYHPVMEAGRVYASTEAKSYCDNMHSTMSNLQRCTTAGPGPCTWSNWAGVRLWQEFDFSRWYRYGEDDPNLWQATHCATIPDCPNLPWD